MQTLSLTPIQLKAYRDDVVNVLYEQIHLLEEIQKSDFFKKNIGHNDEQHSGLLTQESIEEAKPIIHGEIEKLKNFDVVLSVVGTMKAGKSTTINAIVGREILPNRNRPMTALPTRIIHKPGQKQPVLVFENPAVMDFAKKVGQLLKSNPHWSENHQIKENPDLQKLIDNLINNSNATFKTRSAGEDGVYEFLSQLNDLVRLSEMLQMSLLEDQQNNKNSGIKPEDLAFPYHVCRNFDQLPTIEIEFSHLKNSEGVEGRLILLDTPGPNEAGQEQLKPMLEEQLKRSSAVLLVLDFTQLKSEAEQSVREQLAKIPMLAKDRLFALVNKFDERTANSDDAETTKNMIFSDLLRDRINKEHIFPVASQLCYLANRMEEEMASKGKPELGGWVDDFAKEACGARYERKWEKEDKEDILEAIEDIRDASHMQDPIERAIVKTQTEAPQIAIRSALAQVNQALENVQNFCEVHTKLARKTNEEERITLKEQIANLQKSIEALGELQDTEKKKLEGICKGLSSDISHKVDTLIIGCNDECKLFFQKNIDTIQSNKPEKIREWSFSAKSRDELNELKKQRAEAENLLKNNDGDSIVFRNEEDKETFILQMSKLYMLLANAVNAEVTLIMGNGEDEIATALSKAKIECEKELHNIETIFKKEDIVLELSVPNLAAFEKIEGHKIRYQRDMKSKTETYEYEKSGIGSWFARKLWGGGYATSTKTYFFDSKNAIINQIQSDLKIHVFDPVQAQIKNKFDNYNAELIENYIGAVKLQTEKLAQEFSNAIKASELEGQEKAKYLKFIGLLEKRSEAIRDTLHDCRQVFETKESQQSLVEMKG